MTLAAIVDAVLEVPVAPSFTKIGYAARKRLEHWRPLDDYDLTGRTIVVTGATSGLGKHAAGRFASLGAHVVVVGRNPEKTAGVADELRASSTAGTVTTAIADLGELDVGPRARRHAAHRPPSHRHDGAQRRRARARSGVSTATASRSRSRARCSVRSC